MWHNDRIYFASDRDENRRMNLFVYDTQSGLLRRMRNLMEATHVSARTPE